jgi:hypothetical protein
MLSQMTSQPHAFSSFFVACLSLLNIVMWPSVAAAGTWHVTTTNDEQLPGSLRYAVEHASDGDSIDFELSNCPCVIRVTGEQIAVHASININGPGMASLALDGSNAYPSIFFSDAASFQVSNLTLENQGDDLAAVWIGDGVSRFSKVAFVNNSGGAIDISSGVVDISDSFFYNNISDAPTIFQNPCAGCSLRVANSSFIGNKAAHCAAIFSQSPTIIENDTFADNESRASDGVAADGGALCINGGGEIRNSTFVDNVASDRGGALAIFGTAPIMVTNSVFSSNHAMIGPNISGSFVSWGHNLVSDRSGSFGYQNKICNPRSSGLFPSDLPEEDAKLAPLHISKESGLPIITPNPDSPLVDAISIGGGHCDGVDVPHTDARGVNRPHGTAADIGAIEFIPNDDRLFCDQLEGSACQALK